MLIDVIEKSSRGHAKRLNLKVLVYNEAIIILPALTTAARRGLRPAATVSDAPSSANGGVSLLDVGKDSVSGVPVNPSSPAMFTSRLSRNWLTLATLGSGLGV